MSLSESQSRVNDKKKFDENFDDIFRKKDKKKESKAVEVEERATNELYGRVKRYHYSEKKNYKKGEAPAVGGYTSTAEKSISDL